MLDTGTSTCSSPGPSIGLSSNELKMTSVIFRIVTLTFLCMTCSGRTVIDLSHTLDKDVPQYPTGDMLGPNLTYFKNDVAGSYISLPGGTKGVWVAIGKVETVEHVGTHMDAPRHFGKGRQSMAEIPVERLVGPGVVIDVKEKVRENPNYAVSEMDIHEYEDKFGRIPPRSIVIMNSGWSSFYGNPELYLGTTNITDAASFNFPGFGLDTCTFLLAEREVSVVGVDTMSVDPGQAPKENGWPYPCSVHLQTNEVPLLENVANLDSVPPKGTTILLGGMKTRIGTGGPTRIFALA